MLYYTYDNTFEGLLTVIAETLTTKHRPQNIFPQDNLQCSLFADIIHIKTDTNRAQRLFFQLKRLAPETLKNLLYYKLSEKEGLEFALMDYIHAAFELGDRVNNNRYNENIDTILKIGRKVSFEAHRLKGLLRFKKLNNNTYYAPFEPDHNIIDLLAQHFCARLSDQQWLLHDIKRKTALYYNKKDLEPFYISQPNKELLEKKLNSTALAVEESKVQELWCEFFNTIAIKERHNPKLQQKFIPKKYHKYLTEI